jgi:hypothetical protein
MPEDAQPPSSQTVRHLQEAQLKNLAPDPKYAPDLTRMEQLLEQQLKANDY